MADSGALRQRRSKMHKAGNHSLCRSTCPESGKTGPFSVPDGAIQPVGDPVAALRDLAGILTGAYRADPGNAQLARELRMTLQALMVPKDAVDGELAALFAEFAGT